MTISTSSTSLKSDLDRAPAGSLPSMFQAVQIGSVLRAIPTTLRKKAPAASAYNIATLQAFALPDDAKAVSIFRAYGRVGTAAAGELTVDAANATPGTGEIAVSPSGDIVVLAADAWTSVDVEYLPAKYDCFEATLNCVPGTGLVALPASWTNAGVVMVMEAEVLAGTLATKMIVQAPNNSAPATGHARLTLAKTAVHFAVADAATSVRLKVALCAAVDVDALLEAEGDFL